MKQTVLPDYDAAQQDVEVAIGMTRGRLRIVSVIGAVCVWLAATVVVALGFVVADHWLPGGFPDMIRPAILWMYLLGSSLWLMLTVLLPLIRQISDLYVARMVERSHPEFRNSLISAFLFILSRACIYQSKCPPFKLIPAFMLTFP